MKNVICIYMITNTITGDFYIGQTTDMHERELAHRREPPPKMRDDVEEYTWDAFKFEIIEECAKEELNEKENYYITKLDPEYNTIKIHNWTHTPETCKKISEAKMGHSTTPESCELMSSKRLHVSLTDEHIEKCRQASFGNKSRSKPVMCVETGKVYPNMKTAAADVVISPSAISLVLRGITLTAGGYHWRYPDGEENKGSQHRNMPVMDEDTGKIYPTIDAAAADLGISATTISRIAHGQTISTLHFKFLQEPTYNEIRSEDERKNHSACPVICLETGEQFSSIRQAAKALGISHGVISAILRGVGIAANGLHFCYADDRPNKIRDETTRKTTSSKSILCVETGQVFPSLKAAADSLNLNHSNICGVLKGKRPSVGGLHFEYVT